ncbi:MAG: hypothetical protein ACTSX2_04515 [Candidatus Thorarchaeota archaeon]
MEFRSKYFGWLASLLIVLAGSWLLLPAGYETLIMWLAPQMGNYVRPTMIMVNAMLLNPLTNPVMFAVWIIGGLIGGIIAGTKKGGFVVGLMTWLGCLAVLVFSVFQMFSSGIDMGAMPPIPPGSSLLDILSIPIVKDLISQLLPMAFGGTSISDPMEVIAPLLVFVIVPLATVIVAAIIGATIRQKVEY